MDDEQTPFRADLYVWIRVVNSKGTRSTPYRALSRLIAPHRASSRLIAPRALSPYRLIVLSPYAPYRAIAPYHLAAPPASPSSMPCTNYSIGNEFINSTAFLQALRQSPLFWWIPIIIRPSHINKIVKFTKKFMSNTRVKFDDSPNSESEHHGILRNKWSSVFLFFLIGLLTIYKINAPMPISLEPVTPFFKVFRVDQV